MHRQRSAEFQSCATRDVGRVTYGDCGVSVNRIQLIGGMYGRGASARARELSGATQLSFAISSLSSGNCKVHCRTLLEICWYWLVGRKESPMSSDLSLLGNAILPTCSSIKTHFFSSSLALVLESKL